MKVIATQRMAALAMRLRSFLCCGSFNSWRRIIVAKSASIKKSHFKRPSLSNAPCDYVLSHASLTRPILRNHANAHEFNPDIRRTIPILLCTRHPSAILWRVITIVIEAFKRISWRAGAKIGTEVSKTKTFRAFTPSFADNYSSPSVSMEVRRSGEIATPEHVFIQIVKLPIESQGFSHAI